jgi:hypothetical protein
MIAKPEDVNFIKLKLANNVGKTLKSLSVDRILMDHFVETWNECTLKERGQFFNSVGHILRARLKEEAKGLTSRQKKEYSVSSYSSRSSNRVVDDVINTLSPDSFPEGVLKDLSVVLCSSEYLSDSLKESLKGFLSLSKKEIATLRDFTHLFQGQFPEQSMGRGLLSGEKFILTEELYDDFVDEMNNFLHRKHSDGRSAQTNTIYGGISSIVLLLLILIEDKIVDNLYYLRARMFPESPDLPYTALELQNRKKEKAEPIKFLMSPPKERVISIVRPSLDALKYIKLRKCTQPINTTAFIDQRLELGLVGAFYSLTVCQSKGLVSAENIIYANFMGVNHLSTREDMMNLARKVKDQIVTSPSRQDNQSQRSFHNKDMQSYKHYEENKRKWSSSFANPNNLQSTSSRKSEHHDNQYDNDSCHSSSKDFNSPFAKPNQRFGSDFKRNERLNQGENKVFNQGQSTNFSGTAQGQALKAKDRKQSAIYPGVDSQPKLRDRFISNHLVDTQKREVKMEEFDRFNGSNRNELKIPDQVPPKKKSLKATSSSYFHPVKLEFDQVKPDLKPLRDLDGLVKTYSLNLDETHSVGFARAKSDFQEGGCTYSYSRGNGGNAETMSLTHFYNKGEDANDDQASKHSFGSSVNLKEASDVGLHSPRTNGSTDKDLKHRKVKESVSHQEIQITKSDYFVYSGPDKNLLSPDYPPKTELTLSNLEVNYNGGTGARTHVVTNNLNAGCSNPGVSPQGFCHTVQESERRDTGYLPQYDLKDRRISQFDEFGNRKDTGFNMNSMQLMGPPSKRNSNLQDQSLPVDHGSKQNVFDMNSQLENRKDPDDGFHRRNANMNFDFVYQDGPFSRFKEKKSPVHQGIQKDEISHSKQGGQYQKKKS